MEHNQPRPLLRHRLLPLLLLALPAVAQAQFTYTTNDGTITVTGYTGSGGAVIIPSSLGGLPITSIGNSAFSGSSLTTLTIPDSVSSIGEGAFHSCQRLVSITLPHGLRQIAGGLFSGCFNLPSVGIPNGVTSIGRAAFFRCSSLTDLTIPDSVTDMGSSMFVECKKLTRLIIPDGVTRIGTFMFENCWNLTSVIVGNGVVSIGDSAFSHCDNLSGIYFRGNAPSLEGADVFTNSFPTIYNLSGTTGWPGAFMWFWDWDLPKSPWFLPNPIILNHGSSFGVQGNAFGFIISWASAREPVVVEACTNLTAPIWVSVGINSFSGGWSHFSDPQWRQFPNRIYRVHTR